MATHQTVIPLVDLTRQYRSIRREIDSAIHRVLVHGDFVFGSELDAFERDFAAYCGTAYAAGVGSGYDALLLALRALGIGPGDEVIVPAHTFISTVLPIVAVGAKPVLVDIDPRTLLIDPQEIARHITAQTKAIIPVHLYGFVADMERLCALAQAHKLSVIEDACQAHGSMYNGRRAGSMGDIGCFSFYPSKNLGAYGDGGAVVSNNATIMKTIRLLRNVGEGNKHEHVVRGYNSRLDSLQAAVLRVKLRHLDAWNRLRRKHAQAYRRLLAGLAVKPVAEPIGVTGNYHLFVIRTPERNALMSFLRHRGIACGIHYPLPVHLQPCMKELGYTVGDFPIAEAVAQEVVSLPLFPELQHAELARVTRGVADFFHQ